MVKKYPSRNGMVNLFLGHVIQTNQLNDQKIYMNFIIYFSLIIYIVMKWERIR